MASVSASKAQLAIVGVPGSGKSTLAEALGNALQLRVLCTDIYAHLPWEAQADAAMLSIPDRGIVEGITVARLFRRGFSPDCAIWLMHPDDNPKLNSFRSLVKRGLEEYSGRVICLPWRASHETALALIGAGLDA